MGLKLDNKFNNRQLLTEYSYRKSSLAFQLYGTAGLIGLDYHCEIGASICLK